MIVKRIALGLAATIASAVAPTICAQPALQWKTLSIDASKLDPKVRERLTAILLQQKFHDASCVACGPNPDPEYPEFWVELRPATPNDSHLEHQLRLWQHNRPQQLQRGMRGYYQDSPQTAWSEEAFCEITPSFGEMFPEPQDKSRVNFVVTMNIRERGKLVQDKEFYKRILRAAANKR